MPGRHLSRQRALQVLFQQDLTKVSIDQAIAAYYDTLYSEENPAPPAPDPFMEELARGACSRGAELDRTISGKSEHWTIERMPAVDRNILRMAAFEMIHLGTAPPIVIDEALELARQFAGDESIGFINGVLDAIRKEVVRE